MSGDASRASALAAALFAAGCSGEEADFYVRDTGVHVESEAPFARQPDLPARLESTLSAALEYWGGDWRDLRGREVILAAGPYLTCGANDRAVGCYDGDIRVVTSDPGIGPYRCVEQTSLVHEVGHAVIGDRSHRDPRWMQLEPVRDALAGRVGYTGDGEGDCEIFVSVWRHPLGTP